jgi:hypothetical protein
MFVQKERDKDGSKPEFIFSQARTILQLFLIPHLSLSTRRIKTQYKRINRKESARRQHLSRLKASAFLFEIFLLGVRNTSTYT